MKIGFSSGKIQVWPEDTELRPREVSQLGLWGYLFDSEEHCFQKTTDNSRELTKIAEYFKTQKYQASFNGDASSILHETKHRTGEFEKFRDWGRDFKNGRVPISKKDPFINFISSTFLRKLKPHQIKSAFHLYSIRNGANFSVPGSGKTTVILSVYEYLRKNGEVNALFVVGPPACFGPWKDEYKNTFGRKPTSITLAGGNLEARKATYYRRGSIPDLYLTTYQTLLNDQEDVINFFRQQGINIYMVVDEAHYVKKVEGNWANAVLSVSKYAKYRCVLTGSPIPHSYKDLFNLWEFLWPNQQVLTDADRIRLQELEKRLDTEGAKRILEPKISPLFYRVRKKDLGLKPQVFHEPEYIQMREVERKIYDAVFTKIVEYSKEDYNKNIDLVTRLIRGRMIRLRQAVSYPRLLTSAIDDYEEDLFSDKSDLAYLISKYDSLERPAKVDYLLTKVGKLANREKKVIIWANFIWTIKLIHKVFSENGLASKVIIGETPIYSASMKETETRERIINSFKDAKSGLNILLANPAACAESISLHKTCQNAIYYDLSFNGAQYIQSLDRIHRVGGSEKIASDYFYLQCKDTMEGVILQNLRSKLRKMSELIDSDNAIYTIDVSDANEEERLYKEILTANDQSS